MWVRYSCRAVQFSKSFHLGDSWAPFAVRAAATPPWGSHPPLSDCFISHLTKKLWAHFSCKTKGKGIPALACKGCTDFLFFYFFGCITNSCTSMRMCKALHPLLNLPNLTPTRVRPNTTVRLYFTGLWVKTTLGLTLRTHATRPLKNVKTVVFFLSHLLSMIYMYSHIWVHLLLLMWINQTLYTDVIYIITLCFWGVAINILYYYLLYYIIFC